ncbi:MAG TPA: hypothetical protein VKX17_09265 [Planctomycetota bacterium]|nr:hypothetical protein [Planctomycetota bacterium]
MQKWKIAAVSAIVLLMLVIAADAAMIVYYATLPAPKYEAQKTRTPAIQTAALEKSPAPAVVELPKIDAALFPPPPAANGAEKEYWEGYYYYSLDPFEQAVAQNVQRNRFWFEVRRTADGAFQAASNELGGPDASIQGVIDRAKGTMQFEKSYTTGQLNWHYEGDWSPAKRRIDGFYSPPGGARQGGFVLFPRRLQPEEIARYEQRNEDILIQKAVDKDGLDIFNQGQPQGKAPKANDDVF